MEGRPVRNVHFTGITFACTDWPIPAGGYQGIQACHYNTAGNAGQSTGRIPAAVDAKFAEGCSIEDGALVHLGGCGIELGEGCVGNVVQGNRISDVAGNWRDNYIGQREEVLAAGKDTVDNAGPQPSHRLRFARWDAVDE